MRLYDHLVSLDTDNVGQALAGYVLMDASNVAQYYTDNGGGPGISVFEDASMPMIPYERLWLEWTMFGHRYAADIHGLHDNGEYQWATEFLTKLDGLPTIFNRGGWLNHEDGTPKPLADGGPWAILKDPQDYDLIRRSRRQRSTSEEDWDHLTSLCLEIVALTMHFLHCKNVVLEDAPFIGPRQQRRALERKGIKQAKFKTLVIEPMKQVLKTEGDIETNGLKKALHICRGHFATYSEDKPLFGKYSGTFWRPAHVRGNADHGTVYKDYKVKAPKA